MPATTTTTPPPVLRWVHHDADGVEVAIGRGIARAKAGDWIAGDKTSRRDLRGFLVGVSFAEALVGPTAPQNQKGDTVIDVRPSTANTDDQAWQKALTRGVAALVVAAGHTADASGFTGATIATTDGETGTAPVSTSLGWTGVVAIIGVAGTAAGFLYAWLAKSQDTEIEYAKLASDVKAKNVAAELAAATEVIAKHKDAETKAGATVPYDQQELQLLDSLNTSIKELVHWTPPAPKSIPDPNKPLSDLGDTAKKIGTGFEFGIPLALLLAAFMLTR